jgi:acetoin utilization deacetylase AcuC-like enzyme
MLRVLLLLLVWLQVDAPPVSDGDYLTAWHMLVLPVVAEFRPDLVLVSAGFDAVDKDPLGKLGYRVPA